MARERSAPQRLAGLSRDRRCAQHPARPRGRVERRLRRQTRATGIPGREKTARAPPLLPNQLKQIRQCGIPTTPRVWHIEPGRAAEKHVLYAGTAPAALFRSEDDGQSWEIVEGLLKHPTRKHWTPGAGGQCLHSIQLDPTDPNRMYVGISSPGSFRTDDGGRTWKPINEGVKGFPEAPRGLGVGT